MKITVARDTWTQRVVVDRVAGGERERGGRGGGGVGYLGRVVAGLPGGNTRTIL